MAGLHYQASTVEIGRKVGIERKEGVNGLGGEDLVTRGKELVAR